MHLVLVFENGTKTSISYPKFLVEQTLGRKLEPTETVHHIDGDKSNNSIENLEVLERSTHSRYHNPYKEVEITCAWCRQKAMKHEYTVRKNRRNGHAGPFCGRSCAGKYGKSVQMKQT